MAINVELMARNSADRVTSAARETHTTIDAALKAARRMAGARRAKFCGDAGGVLWIIGTHGKAYVIR